MMYASEISIYQIWSVFSKFIITINRKIGKLWNRTSKLKLILKSRCSSRRLRERFCFPLFFLIFILNLDQSSRSYIAKSIFRVTFSVFIQPKFPSSDLHNTLPQLNWFETFCKSSPHLNYDYWPSVNVCLLRTTSIRSQNT